jgi:hypothetical protein
MRLTAAILLLAATACADERTVPLVNAPPGQAMQEMATVLRTVIDIPKLTVNPANFVLEGTPAQLDAAEWIIHEFDKCGHASTGALVCSGTSSTHEFRLPPETHGPIIRIYYLSDPGIKTLQEELTILRAVIDVQKIFQYSPLQALVYRDLDSDTEDVEWLLHALEAHVTSVPHRLLVGRPRDLVRVFALPPGTTVPQLFNIVSTLRAAPVAATKVFARSVPPAIVIRGTSEQLEEAEAIVTKGNQ